MPALGELAGHEVVAGVEAGQPREVSKAGVGGQDENEHRARLKAVEEHVACRAGAEDELADLGDHRRRALVIGVHVEVGIEPRQPEEHRPQGRAHDHERGAGVLPLRPPEGGHAV